MQGYHGPWPAVGGGGGGGGGAGIYGGRIAFTDPVHPDAADDGDLETPFLTIQAAITAAAAAGGNHQVLVAPGTYTENVTLAAGVTLVALQDDVRGFDATGEAPAEVVIAGVVTIDADSGDFGMSGISVVPPNAGPAGRAVHLTGTGGYYFGARNCRFIGNAGPGLWVTQEATVDLFGCYLSSTTNAGTPLIAWATDAVLNIEDCVIVAPDKTGDPAVSLKNCTLRMRETEVQGQFRGAGGSTSTIYGGVIDTGAAGGQASCSILITDAATLHGTVLVTDTDPPLTGAGTYWRSDNILMVDSDPDGGVSARRGTLAVKQTAPVSVHQNTDGATAWSQIGGAPELVWDWANEDPEDLDTPSVDQLQGNVDVSLWADATAYDSGGLRSDPLALDSFTAPASCGSKVIVCVKTANSSGCSGILMPTKSGDFIYAMRLGVGLHTPTTGASFGVNYSFGGGAGIHGVYVDHASDVTLGAWYGAGIYWPGTNWTSHTVGSHQASGADYWNTLTTGNGLGRTSGNTSSVVNEIDVWLQRDGTALYLFASSASGTPTLIDNFTVSANAGLVGLRLFLPTTGLGTEPKMRGYLKAFGRVSNVPGF